MFLALIVVALLLALAFLPQMWIKQVIARHSAPRPDIVLSGGDLARSLLDRLGLTHISVEPTTLGDHYDPEAKAVRLLDGNFSGHSLAATVIAAHEVGHAMQDATGYTPLAARQRLAKQAARVDKLGVVLMIAAPILMVVSRSPVIMVLVLGAGVVVMCYSVMIHAFTLPVELDASFKRALPLLDAANVLNPADKPAARQLLRAAALTYVAAAAMTLLDVARWLRVLRL
jgi:uncharacterized protein